MYYNLINYIKIIVLPTFTIIYALEAFPAIVTVWWK